MKRLPLLLSLFIASLAIAQKPMSIVGVWVPDATTIAADKNTKDFQFTFEKNGHMAFKGLNTVGEGTYVVVKGALTITLSKRNGVTPTTPQEKTGRGTLSKDGKQIALE